MGVLADGHRLDFIFNERERLDQQGKKQYGIGCHRSLVLKSSPHVYMPFDPLKLADHFNKHRADFQVSSDKDYEALADGFVARLHHPDLVECRRKMGDFIRYDGLTEEYAVISGTGVIRTYFKPVPCASLPPSVPRPNCHNQVDNITYFRKECAKR